MQTPRGGEVHGTPKRVHNSSPTPNTKLLHRPTLSNLVAADMFSICSLSHLLDLGLLPLPDIARGNRCGTVRNPGGLAEREEEGSPGRPPPLRSSKPSLLPPLLLSSASESDVSPAQMKWTPCMTQTARSTTGDLQ